MEGGVLDTVQLEGKYCTGGLRLKNPGTLTQPFHPHLIEKYVCLPASHMPKVHLRGGGKCVSLLTTMQHALSSGPFG